MGLSGPGHERVACCSASPELPLGRCGSPSRPKAGRQGKGQLSKGALELECL